VVSLLAKSGIFFSNLGLRSWFVKRGVQTVDGQWDTLPIAGQREGPRAGVRGTPWELPPPALPK